MAKKNWILLMSLGIFISGFLVYLVTTRLLFPSSSEADTSKLKIYNGMGGNFTLTDHQGTPFQLEQMQGKVVLLTFGYTSCPDVCPMILDRLKQVHTNLGSSSNKVQTLFVSFDTKRDTPEQLKNYVTFFHPTFLGLTGTESEVRQVTKQYGAAFFQQGEPSAAGTLFAHSDFVYLIDQKGQVRTLYRNEEKIDKITEDIQYLISSIKT